MTRRVRAFGYAKCCACGALVDIPPNPPAELIFACSRECGVYYLGRHDLGDDAKHVRWPTEQLRPHPPQNIPTPTKYDQTQVVAAVIVLATFVLTLLYFVGIVRGVW